MTITLYRLEGCPWCEKVADKLDELDVQYDSIWVDALHSQRDDVKEISGQRKVPVIVDQDTDVTMPESSRIIEYLEAKYGA